MSDLTLLDPCMGSGHILREGFDLLFAMYREQAPELDAAAIVERIFRSHLYGIDIDPRAAQLAALTLLLRAWETLRAHHSQFSLHDSRFTIALNLATTPTFPPGALARHLQSHPEDEVYRPLLAGVFAALEQAPLLGSLLRPEEQLDGAIAAFRQQAGKGGQLGLVGESTAANALLEELGKHDPAELKRLLLARIERSFGREAHAGDVGAQLLGREGGEGVHLLQILGRRYAVVCTNPPYMGSGNLSENRTEYIDSHYYAGRHDLYSAFILQCIHLSKPTGRAALVTMHGWMFQNSYADLRSGTLFDGLIHRTSIEGLVHLGRYAFTELGNAVIAPVLFVLSNKLPMPQHRVWACRLVAPRPSEEQASLLRYSLKSQVPSVVSLPIQVKLAQITGAPILYWLPDRLLTISATNSTLGELAHVGEGLSTSSNDRYVRYWWEISARNSGRWLPLCKGGTYQKWAGLEWYVVEWEFDGSRVKRLILERYPYLNGNYGFKIKDEEYYRHEVLTYSTMARGSLGVRYASSHLFDNSGGFVFTNDSKFFWQIAAILNSRIASFLVRSLTQSLSLKYTYLRKLPVPKTLPGPSSLIEVLANEALWCTRLLADHDAVERNYVGTVGGPSREAVIAVRLSVESTIERAVNEAYELDAQSAELVHSETGIPVGFYGLLAGYDGISELLGDLGQVKVSSELVDELANHNRIELSASDLTNLKSRLRLLYEGGPDTNAEHKDSSRRVQAQELAPILASEMGGDDDAPIAGAYIPIPTETFLEELSVKLQIHPISVYWLLEELRAEGVRCKPEELRLLEDRLSVLVLRLLGHRWPRQFEAGEPVPPWADRDGVIPLTAGTGESTLAQRVRERLRAEEGDLGAQRTEALLQELTGRSLAEWLRRDFFKRHVRQFKKRPVAWQVASKPGARGEGRGARRAGAEPAFECIVYYHRTDGDLLARVRTQYVERLLERDQAIVGQARQGAAVDATAVAVAAGRIRELEEFAARLRAVEEQGFASPELEELLAAEPLDRWSGDGILAPASQAALLAQEQAWRVDINDGVRVNVAPLQLAGLLAADVLATKDLRKAVADRARWRSDERRWVRQGKLPRCGWMAEDVPESPRWTELAPEREKERLRLEEKRRKVLAELTAR